jgi:hypothetical protein
MDHDREIALLHAETFAMQAVMIHLIRELSRAGLEPAVSAALNGAASQVEDIAIALGKAASPDHMVKAIRVVEEIRAATLGNHDKPRHGV